MKTKNIFSLVALSLLLIVPSVSAASAHSDKGGKMSEQHQSTVAKVVHDLTELAGKDTNIGEEVTSVAQDQETSNERATTAMQAVEARGGFKTFLIGTDYKNIGALRSEIVTTQNSIDRLTKAKERTTDDAVKADLDTQIQALEETNANTLDFIKENESNFSLLGWFVRIFR